MLCTKLGTAYLLTEIDSSVPAARNAAAVRGVVGGTRLEIAHACDACKILLSLRHAIELDERTVRLEAVDMVVVQLVQC